MSMKKILLALACSAVFCSTAMADQAMVVEKDAADAAQKILRAQSEVRHLCEPCGEELAVAETVGSVEVRKWDEDGYYEVYLNGEGIDLAYVYVEDGGAWVNLALKLSLDVDGVSRVLKE
jgi:hypothetical protein